MNEFIFDQPYRHMTWRVQIVTLHESPIVSVWPWYRGKDGQMHPGAARFGGGFQMPFARLAVLRDAIAASIEQHCPSV